jgi:uridylate kinase
MDRKDHRDHTVPYKRVLLKLSGEALMGEGSFGIQPAVLERLISEMKAVVDLGVQLGIVIGGGNIFRGIALSRAGVERVTADQMGMLATVMNALAMREALESVGVQTRIMSAIPISGIVDHYDRRKAIHQLQVGRVVIFAAGTGNPLVTTDSAASLRGIEISADIVLKATNVDGIYSEDPAKNPNSTRYEHLTYQQALEDELGVMDLAAFCQCRDYNMPLRVFNINNPGALVRVAQGEPEGTLVSGAVVAQSVARQG